MNKVRITIDVLEEHIEKIMEECERDDRSRNYVINKAIAKYFENKGDVKNEKRQ
jgi:predicted transcriptional regulator